MASIVSLNISSDNKKVDMKISMNFEEYLKLDNHTTNIRIFSEDAASEKSKIRSAGKNGETKYLLIPKKAKNEIEKGDIVNCQCRNESGKLLLFYSVDK